MYKCAYSRQESSRTRAWSTVTFLCINKVVLRRIRKSIAMNMSINKIMQHSQQKRTRLQQFFFFFLYYGGQPQERGQSAVGGVSRLVRPSACLRLYGRVVNGTNGMGDKFANGGTLGTLSQPLTQSMQHLKRFTRINHELDPPCTPPQSHALMQLELQTS